MGSPGDTHGKEATCQCEDIRDVGSVPAKIPWRRSWQPTPVFLPGEFHGQRRLVGCSPWDHKQLDMSEMTEHACKLSRFSHVRLSVTPWTVTLQAPLSMGSSRQEYWSGLPCPPPGGLPDPRIESVSLTSLALAGGFFTTSTTWKARCVL